MANNRAFEILYQDYYGRVFGLCRRLLNSSELAEDATQETFMRAYRNFRKYKADQPFWQWIAAIANNHCIDVLRKQNKTQDLFGEDEDALESSEDPATTLAELTKAEDAEAVNQAIDALPDKYRVPLVLAYFNSLSYDEIAEQLSVSRTHVGVLLLRAKQKLRLALTETAEGQA